jgi:rhodanese-related sulfurtransferase/ubiquinone/menaquinone biosynthesis C-methylase UbiE
MTAEGMAESSSHPVSERWTDWRRRVDLDEYFARWDQLAAAGQATHGEADFIEALQPSSVLDAGCGMGRVAIELARRGIDAEGADLDDDLLAYARRAAPELTWHHADLASMQLPRRYGMVAMPGNVMIFCRVEHRRLVLHSAAQHLEPGGLVVAGFSLEQRANALTLAEYDELCAACELQFVDRFATWEREPYAGGDYAVSVHRRSARFNVHDLVSEARGRISRFTPDGLQAAIAADPDLLVVDTRTPTDRLRFGVIAGSVHVPRTLVEWHLDPANGFMHPSVSSFDQQIVLVCNGGYSTSLAADNLRRLGYRRAGDLIGGVSAWKQAGLPVVAPDHSHLDY